METVNGPYPYALMIPQSDTERLLEERLNELGVSVERGVEVTSVSLRSDGVDAVLRNADGREEKASADWLAGCDGAHSLVRHTVGAIFAGHTMDSDWMLADVHMRGYPVPDSEASVYWHKDGVFVIFPISRGATACLLICRPPAKFSRPRQRWSMFRQSSIAWPPGTASIQTVAGLQLTGARSQAIAGGMPFSAAMRPMCTVPPEVRA